MTVPSPVPAGTERELLFEVAMRALGPIQPETFLAAAKAYSDGGVAPLGAAVIAAVQAEAPLIVRAALAAAVSSSPATPEGGRR